jgi:hypothetical protein
MVQATLVPLNHNQKFRLLQVMWPPSVLAFKIEYKLFLTNAF